MSQPRTTATKFSALVLSISLGLTLVLRPAMAVEAVPPVERIEKCAVLQSFSGEIQVFNADRSGFLEPEAGGSIPCGGWISMGEGHAVLTHRDGYQIQLGNDSFVEVSAISSLTPQHLVLYRGSGYFQAGEGSSELVVATANGLVRAKSGAFILTYRKSQDETQVVSFSRDLRFANRFQPDQTQLVRAGESSLVNFKRERATPSVPRAVAQASLKEFVTVLEMDARTFAVAAQAAKARADRRLASDLNLSDGSDGGEKSKKIKKGSYDRYPASAEDNTLNEHFANHIVGGSAAGRKLLGSKNQSGRGPASVNSDFAQGVHGKKGRVEVEGKGKSDDAEKRRLMDELSKVRAD